MKSTDLIAADLPPLVIGACEWVGLPSLGISALRARVDTGARSCALHASDQVAFKKSGIDWVSFHVHVGFDKTRRSIACEARLFDIRKVKSSSGDIEERFTIQVPLVIGAYSWPVEITLTNRERMRYRMLIGRAAMRDHAIVYPARTFLQGKPDIKTYQRHHDANSDTL